MEVFKDIEGYEGLYKISSYGRVYSVPRIDTMNVKRGGIYLKPNAKKNGSQYRVGLHKNNTLTLHIVSHLVAKAYPEICGKWFEGCEVHHKNHNPSDNRAKNLIVLSAEEHKKYHSLSTETWNNRSAAQKEVYKRGKRLPVKCNERAVMQFTLKGEYINTYPSLAQAGEKTNTNVPSLCECLKGHNKTAGGYLWKYVS